MSSIHSAHRKEISRDFFVLFADAPSEDRNTTLFNNEERLNFSNATFYSTQDTNGIFDAF